MSGESVCLHGESICLHCESVCLVNQCLVSQRVSVNQCVW